MKVAVVGGGIGGLAAANALLQRGIEVRVYERAGHLGEIGAGVFITPNSLRLLARMGLGDALARASAHIGDQSHYYRPDGAPITSIRTTDSAGATRVCGMHRADLISVLAAGLPRDVVHTGHDCTHVEQTRDSARLRFTNDEVAEADVVVAADGIHSTLLPFVTEPSQPVYSGSIAYRGLLPATAVPDWPNDRWEMWLGEGKHFLVFPVRAGTMLNYVGFVPRKHEVEESWSAPGDTGELAASFAGWDPRLLRLAGNVRETFWWGLYDRAPLQRWTRGRLALLGDAAHPMLPHLGQGANQAIEDAVTLAICLSGSRTDAIPDSLHTYESIRRDRTGTVQQGSRANGARYDSAYDDLAQRDAELAAAVEFRAWLYDYDAEAVATQISARSDPRPVSPSEGSAQ